jgi:hypothetical protein
LIELVFKNVRIDLSLEKGDRFIFEYPSKRPRSGFLPIHKPGLAPRQPLHQLPQSANCFAGRQDQVYVIRHQAQSVHLYAVERFEVSQRAQGVPIKRDVRASWLFCQINRRSIKSFFRCTFPTAAIKNARFILIVAVSIESKRPTIIIAKIA